ncbi:vacuole membrane protein 1 isoform X2 [Episyrphus balteatus]|uniref:vacuole membrane protein 1 isoform X2 n=1 Tax=Episyrphus balteatus TaxID=286459 RepID=UPI0024866924|nr:vacuole membrane protein 1 isoform X2 [Episyrphus balteatus]
MTQGLLQRLGIKMSQMQKKVQQNIDNSPRSRKNNSNMDLNLKPAHTTGASSQKKSNGSPNGSPAQQQQIVMKKKSQKTNKEKEREEREELVLLRSPIQTIKYCSLEIVTLTQTYGKKLLQHRTLLVGFLILAIILGSLYNIPGRHQIAIEIIRRNTWFFIYWIGLGILSSVGLGTGLHTFLLYLGPHIASVTLAAYECNALNFPKPPYPDDIICPDVPNLSQPPNLWNIMRKVRLEAFLWGAGTALGELPPYFMAKAARLSGYDPEDAEDIAAYEELKAKKGQKDLGIVDRGKLLMERVVERIGFFGILACASIPNPLFDLAGITCGHFLVPFWTFFGATLIGKAIIKMHIQKVFVIIAFNESLIERAVDMLQIVPVFGKKLQEPFKGFLQNQKHRLHRQKNAGVTESGNLLSKVFETFVICMVCYFVMSIVNSLAQNYHKRIHKKGKKVLKKVARD